MMTRLKKVLRQIPGLVGFYRQARFLPCVIRHARAYTREARAYTQESMDQAHLKREFNSDTPIEQLWHRRVLDVVSHQLGTDRWGDTFEAGCSEGAFTAHLAQRCRTVNAYDISPVARRRAAERCAGHVHVQVGLLNIITDEIPGQYDLVFAMDVLYYVNGRKRMAAVVRKLVGALRHGGYFVFTDCRVGPDMRQRWWSRWLPKGADDYTAFLVTDFGLRCIYQETYPSEGHHIPGYPDKRIALFEKTVSPQAAVVSKAPSDPQAYFLLRTA